MRLVLVDGGETAWEGPDNHVVCSVLEFVCHTVNELVKNDGVRLEYIDASDSPLLAVAPPGVNKNGPLTLARGYREDGSWFMAGVGAGISVEEVMRWGPSNSNSAEISSTMKDQMDYPDFERAIKRQIEIFQQTVESAKILRQRIGDGSKSIISYHSAKDVRAAKERAQEENEKPDNVTVH